MLRQDQDQQDEDPIREIHAMIPQPPLPANRGRRREAWETSSHVSSSLSVGSSEENFTTMSREFNALVIAGTGITNGNENSGNNSNTNLVGIGEDEVLEETNPLAIVADHSPLELDPPLPSPTRVGSSFPSVSSVQRVKKEEVETKISAWQTAEIAKINNRFKREDAIIKGWENEQVNKSTSWMKKIERKLEEKRARAMEKMQNEVAKARRKAEERRASAEAKRGIKVARVLEVSNLMRVVGRPPVKRSFF